MTITIQLSQQTEKTLEAVARAKGFADVAAYVQHLAEENAQQAEEASSLREEFQRLADQWREETQYLSLAKRMAEHPAYRRIVAMGEKAVPLILAELERKPDHWFIALHEITGAEARYGKWPRRGSTGYASTVMAGNPGAEAIT